MCRKLQNLYSYLAVLLCISCKTSTKDQTQLSHDPGVYLSENSPFQWGAISREKILARLNLTEEKVLPAEHAATKRLQQWVDAIDSNVRNSLSPIDSKSIPRPKVLIIKNPEVNAAVGAFFYDTPAPVIFGSRISGLFRVQNPEFAYLYDRSHDGISTLATKFNSLKGEALAIGSGEKPPIDDSQILPWIRWSLSQRSGKDCDLKQVSKTLGTITIPKSCAKKAELDEIGLAKNPLKLSMVADWVFINTGLIEAVPEQSTVSIIAHELAHYYRAHPVSPKRDTCYDYRLGDKNPSCKPPKDPKAASILELVEEANLYGWGTEKNWSQIEKPISFYKEHQIEWALDRGIAIVTPDSMKSDLAMYVFDKSRFNEFEKACPEYVRDLLAHNNNPFVGGIKNLSQTRKKCLGSIRIDSLAGRQFRGYWNQLNPKWTYRTGNITPSSQTISLDSYMNQIAEAMRARENQVLSARQYAAELGYYTQEQEADDLGLEFVIKIGVDPKSFIEGFFKMMEKVGRERSEAEYCRQLYENKWVDPSTGKPAFVEIGPKSDEHHTLCFRIRNLDRELEAHDWKSKQGQLPFPLLSQEAWMTLSR